MASRYFLFWRRIQGTKGEDLQQLCAVVAQDRASALQLVEEELDDLATAAQGDGGDGPPPDGAREPAFRKGPDWTLGRSADLDNPQVLGLYVTR